MVAIRSLFRDVEQALHALRQHEILRASVTPASAATTTTPVQLNVPCNDMCACLYPSACVHVYEVLLYKHTCDLLRIVLVDPSVIAGAPSAAENGQVPGWYQRLRFWSAVAATAALAVILLHRRAKARGRKRARVRPANEYA